MESLKAAARLIDDKPDYSRQFEAGMSVEADFNGEGSFYPGEVVKVHTDGACDVDYSDGDKESRVPRSRIRLLAAAAVKKAGEDLGLNENARGQSLHAKEAVGNRLARVEEATATSSSKPKPKPSSSSETVSRGQREGDTNLDEAKRNEEEDDEDEAEEDNTEEGNKAGSGAAGVLNEVGRPILAELVLHEVADKGSNAQVKSGGAAAAAAATLTDSEVATTGNSHLPPKPRALSDLPKGSGLRVSVLKLSQRETPPRELRAALKESAARLQSRVEGSGRDEESKEGNDDGGGGGGSGFSAGSGSGLSGAELAVLRQSDFSGWTALHWAASTAQKEVTLELLALEKQAKRKLSLNKGHDGEDAQNDDDGGGNEDGAKAVGSGSESEEGARLVDARDELNGWTPLHLAAVGGSAEHFRVARALVESGRADLEAKDICGDAPRDVVSARGAALGDWKRLLSKGEVDAPTPRLRKAPDGKGGGGGGSGGGGGGDGDQHDRDRHHRHHRRHHHHDDDRSASDQRRRRHSGKSRDRSHHHHSRHDRARDGT